MWELGDYVKMAEEKENSVILAKQMDEQLKIDCATLERQEIAVFEAEVSILALDDIKERYPVAALLTDHAAMGR